VANLQEAIRRWERKSVHEDSAVRSTGCRALDDLFPAQGIRRGSLVEWLATDNGSGAVTVSLIAGRNTCQAERSPANIRVNTETERGYGSIVLIDEHRELNPVALQALGLDLSRIVLVRPDTEREALWACEEALRCPAVGLVWTRPGRLSVTSFRRLQLAAEEAKTIGFLVREESVLKQPSWADVRLLVRPCVSQETSARFQIDVAYGMGKSLCSRNEIQIDSVQGTIHDVSSFRPANSLPVDS
jgi:protein ImuA